MPKKDLHFVSYAVIVLFPCRNPEAVSSAIGEKFFNPATQSSYICQGGNRPIHMSRWLYLERAQQPNMPWRTLEQSKAFMHQ